MTSIFSPDKHPLALLSSTHSLCSPEEASALSEQGKIEMLFYIIGESIKFGKKNITSVSMTVVGDKMYIILVDDNIVSSNVNEKPKTPGDSFEVQS